MKPGVVIVSDCEIRVEVGNNTHIPHWITGNVTQNTTSTSASTVISTTQTVSDTEITNPPQDLASKTPSLEPKQTTTINTNLKPDFTTNPSTSTVKTETIHFKFPMKTEGYFTTQQTKPTIKTETTSFKFPVKTEGYSTTLQTLPTVKTELTTVKPSTKFKEHLSSTVTDKSLTLTPQNELATIKTEVVKKENTVSSNSGEVVFWMREVDAKAFIISLAVFGGLAWITVVIL